MLAEVRIVPGPSELTTDRPIYRAGMGMTNLHGLGVLSFPSDSKQVPQQINLSAEIALRGESGTLLWEGTVHYQNLAWPRRGLALVDTPLSRPVRIVPRPLAEDGPK
jgi:hypothetical protein